MKVFGFRILIVVVLCVSPCIAIQPDAIGELQVAEIIAVLKQHWLYRTRLNWEEFESRVMARARGARTIEATEDAIRLALTLLKDRHSYYVRRTGESMFNPESPTQSTGECTPPPAKPVVPPDGIGYIRVRIASGAAGADAIAQALRAGAGTASKGWLVDMRDSRGGNMWPFLAALGPLLGNGKAGSFVDAAGAATPWGYTDGRAWLADEVIIENPSSIQSLFTAKVAVLIDLGVASSGEAIAIAFRGRPQTRSFGTSTCGLSTAVSQLSLKTGGRLAVVTGVMADRTGRLYGGPIEPDEKVVNPDDVLARAVAWIEGR